jgi:DNA-binding transcriptional LysR family regulator
VNLTDAGLRLASEAGPALEVAAQALGATASKRREIGGVLRLNVPRLASRVALPPLIAAYTRDHPEMRIDAVVEDRNVDIVRDGFDAGVRLREAVEKDMVTTRISGPIRFVVAAAPSYLAKHGEPRHPRELVDHACIAWRSPTSGDIYRWEFESRGRAMEVGVTGPITSSDADLLVACAAPRPEGLEPARRSRARRGWSVVGTGVSHQRRRDDADPGRGRSSLHALNTKDR